MSTDQCEKKRISYIHAREEVEKEIASPYYDKERCESLKMNAEIKEQAYRLCLYYSGKSVPIMYVPACPYKESYAVMDAAGKPIITPPPEEEEVVKGERPRLVSEAKACMATAIGLAPVLLSFLRNVVRPVLPMWFTVSYYRLSYWMLNSG